MKYEYKPMIGKLARIALNDLGYNIEGSDNKELVILGVIVTLANKIRYLEEEIEKIKSR